MNSPGAIRADIRCLKFNNIAAPAKHRSEGSAWRGGRRGCTKKKARERGTEMKFGAV